MATVPGIHMSRNGTSPSGTRSPERKAHKYNHDNRQVTVANATAADIEL